MALTFSGTTMLISNHITISSSHSVRNRIRTSHTGNLTSVLCGYILCFEFLQWWLMGALQIPHLSLSFTMGTWLSTGSGRHSDAAHEIRLIGCYILLNVVPKTVPLSGSSRSPLDHLLPFGRLASLEAIRLFISLKRRCLNC